MYQHLECRTSLIAERAYLAHTYVSRAQYEVNRSTCKPARNVLEHNSELCPFRTCPLCVRFSRDVMRLAKRLTNDIALLVLRHIRLSAFSQSRLARSAHLERDTKWIKLTIPPLYGIAKALIYIFSYAWLGGTVPGLVPCTTTHGVQRVWCR